MRAESDGAQRRLAYIYISLNPHVPLLLCVPPFCLILFCYVFLFEEFFCCMLRSAVPAILNRQQPTRIDRKKTCSRYRRGPLTALNKKTASLADSLPDDDVDVAGEKCRQHPADIRSRLAMIYFISPYFLAIPSLFPSPCLAIFFTQTLLCPRTVHFSAGAEKVVQFKLS